MTPTYKVSVIVPCYNVEQFLPRCLDSLVNQTLKDIEIICVNDASPDNSIAILRDYEARYDNIVVIDLKENVRQGGARNRGIEIARGEYITFVDSDDWVELDMMEKLYCKAVETGVDVVACGFDLIDQNNHIIRLHIDLQRCSMNGLITNDEQRNTLLQKATSIAWGYLIRSEFLYKHPDIRYPEHLFYEDCYFGLLVYVYTNGYVYLPEALYHFYCNLDSTTRARNSTHLGDRLKTMKMTVDYFREHGLDQKYCQILNLSVSFICYLTATDYLVRTDNPQYAFIKEVGRYARTCRINRDNPLLLKDRGKRLVVGITLLRHWPRMFWYLWKLKQRLKRR